MDWKVAVASFVSVFLAELADKTQLAVISFSASSRSPVSVFAGAASALVISTLIAAALGGIIARLVPPRYAQLAAGAIFLLIGSFLIIRNVRPA